MRARSGTDRSNVEFADAVDLIRRIQAAGTPAARLSTLMKSLPQCAIAIRELAHLPTIRVESAGFLPVTFYSPYDAGGRLRRMLLWALFRAGLPRWRYGRAVLPIPGTMEEYLRGKQRQAVRTNISNARRNNIEIRPVASSADGERLGAQIARHGKSPTDEQSASRRRAARPTAGLSYLAAYRDGDRAIGIVAYLIDGPWARMEGLRCLPDDPMSSPARYLLHTALVEILVGAGVTHLYSDSALLVPPGVRYLQDRIGYQVVNLRISSARERPPLPRTAPDDSPPTLKSDELSGGTGKVRLSRAVMVTLRALRERGIRQTARLVGHYLQEWQFDRSHDLRTLGYVGSTEVEHVGDTLGYHYIAVPPSDLTRALRTFVTAERRGGFVDLGCGKGRGLAIAAAAGFTSVTGIEYVAEFCEQARANMASYSERHAGAPKVQVLNIDAASYLPASTDQVFFMFNPFPAEILRSVLANIENSFREFKRDIVVLYVNPVHAVEFETSDIWRREGEFQGEYLVAAYRVAATGSIASA